MSMDVFISYSRKDTPIADKICAALDNAKISYFIDRKGISGGAEFYKILAEAILNCKIFLYLASANSYTSKYAKKEVAFALNMRAQAIIPYIIDDAEMPMDLVLGFADLNCRNIKEHPIHTTLINDICILVGKERVTPSATTVPTPEETPEQLYQKGYDYYNKKNCAEAVKWWRKAAEQGYPGAQYNLGVCLYFGEGISQNFSEAVKWYRKAAEQRHPGAQYCLGVCYYYGNGVSEDKAEAVKWYRKAAEQGNADAQYYLGICYCNGEGVSQDYTEAVKWFRKAAGQGNADAQNNLGDCYYYGIGVSEDKTEAVKWYRKAAEQENRLAHNLGFCYEKGYGVSQDKTEAVKWYRKAANMDRRSQNRLKELGLTW